VPGLPGTASSKSNSAPGEPGTYKNQMNQIPHNPNDVNARRKRVRRTALWIGGIVVLVYVGFIVLVGLSK
jgi:hypothetical protein